LRIWAVKKSTKRRDARSPAPAIIAGTGSPVAGSMMVSAVLLTGLAIDIGQFGDHPPPPIIGHASLEQKEDYYDGNHNPHPGAVGAL
jgi:hypothetical protein